MNCFDAVVVGGGVAGSATAVELLSAGCQVAILSRGDETPRLETISPATVSRLNALNIEIDHHFSEVVAWWGSDRESHAKYPDAAIVQRRVLGEKLRLLALQRGTTIIEIFKVTSIQKHTDWVFQYQLSDGRPATAAATYLVDATGRTSVIGRGLGSKRHTIDQLICISAAVSKPRLLGTWTESTPDGWWNLCSHEEEGTLSYYSIGRFIRSVRDLSRQFSETRHLRHLLPKPTIGKVTIIPCGSSLLIPCSGSDWVSVGDAASTVQPLASSGISKALRDSRRVFDALERESLNYNRYQASEFTWYINELTKQYSLEKRWPSSSFWNAYHNKFVSIPMKSHILSPIPPF